MAVGTSFAMNEISCVISSRSTQNRTNHQGRAVAPSGVPALTETASRMCTDVRLAKAWLKKVFIIQGLLRDAGRCLSESESF